jgi:O-succinylbenzoate synthase
VLKPSLHGGFNGCSEWIQLAEENEIAWWMTSALESSIGLNAIAQFTATFSDLLPQGLGTGGLYTNNFDSSLVVSKGQLSIL